MRRFLTLLFITASFNLFAQPANDNCANAIVMPVQNGSCAMDTSGTTLAATQSTQTAYIPFAADDDVWFKFTTPSGGSAGAVKVVIKIANVNYGANTPQTIHLEVREGAGICADYYPNSGTVSATGGLWLLKTLNPSTEYMIRVYSDDNVSRINSFSICAYTPTPPANDDCTSATAISLSSNTGFAVQSQGTMGASASTQTAGNASGKDDDVWFSFTTPASTLAGQAIISEHIFDAGFGQVVLEIWDVCGSSTYLNWISSSTTLNLGTLLPSTTYRIRVYSSGTTSRFTTFKLTINLFAPPPANDTYTNASTITLSSNTTCTQIVTGGTTVAASSEFPPPCAGAITTPPNDVWYKFIPTTPAATIQITNVTLVSGTNPQVYMELFRGSNTNSVLCSNTNTLELDGSDVAHTLLPGTTYYLRIYNSDGASASTFNICNKVLPPPVNDNCPGAINIPVNNSTGTLIVSATSVGATASATGFTCSGNASSDIWFKFKAPASGQVNVSITNARILVYISFAEINFAVYSGTCAAPTLVTCNNSPSGAITGLTAGNDYYLRTFDNIGNQYAFDIGIQEIPATATNTTCLTALPITADWRTGSTFGIGTTNLVACSGGPASTNKELWYSFTATATKHLVDFSDMVRLSPDQNNIGYKVYSGTCAVPGAPIHCVSNVVYGNSVVNGLVNGNTYYVQLMENTYNGGPVMFKIKTAANVPPSNNESTGAVTLVQNPDCKSTPGTFKFSTLSANSISGSYIEDVWYRFVASTADAVISINGFHHIVVYNSNATTVFTDGGASVNNVPLTGMTPGNTYYIRLYNSATTPSVGPDADFTICVYGTPSMVAADVATPGSTCQTIDGPATSTNSGRWLHLTHMGKLVASVMDTSGGTGMGLLTAKYFINGGTVRADASGTEYLDRNFEITPLIQPTKAVAVRLYFTKSEFNALVGANDGDMNDVYYLNDLKVAKFSSVGCSNTLNLSGEVLYAISNWGSISGTVYYIEMTIPSFSSFFLKNSATALPVTCTGFNAARKNNRIVLSWATATESNTSHFEIQRSDDGKNFTAINTVPAKGSGASYYYSDEVSASDAVYYYRLLAVDNDGTKRFSCNIVKVGANGIRQPLFGNAYPNPVTSELNVRLNRSYNGIVGLQVISATGNILQSRPVEIRPSDSRITLNTVNLPMGVYVVRLQTSEGIESIRFTKQ